MGRKVEICPDYSVAIRTLGKAGVIYEDLIRSIKTQSYPPQGIYVYIAEGYKLPEQVADEIYISCSKGMVHQRSLPFNEISSKYILFCDDDVFFPPDAVEKLFKALKEHDANCIAPNVFPNHELPLKSKIINAAFYGTFPSFSRKYAFAIRWSSYYSYAIFPKTIMLTQSFAGPCFLVEKGTYLDAHFEEERWIDKFHYPNGEDQLFANKLFLLGYKILVHYDSGIVHRDAQTSQTDGQRARDFNNRVIRYIIWYRTVYQTRKNVLEKVFAVVGYYSYWLWLFVLALITWVLRRNVYKVRDSISSLKVAKGMVRSAEFKQIPEWRVNTKRVV